MPKKAIKPVAIADEWDEETGEILTPSEASTEAPAAVGHNDGPAWDDEPPKGNVVVVGEDDALTASAVTRLRTIVERIERLEDDIEAVQNDRKDVYAEAKGEGYDVKVLRKLIALRKRDKAKVAEENAILDLYQSAVDGLPG